MHELLASVPPTIFNVDHCPAVSCQLVRFELFRCVQFGAAYLHRSISNRKRVLPRRCLVGIPSAQPYKCIVQCLAAQGRVPGDAVPGIPSSGWRTSSSEQPGPCGLSLTQRYEDKRTEEKHPRHLSCTLQFLRKRPLQDKTSQLPPFPILTRA